jgi:hypothetical protein
MLGGGGVNKKISKSFQILQKHDNHVKKYNRTSPQEEIKKISTMHCMQVDVRLVKCP